MIVGYIIAIVCIILGVFYSVYYCKRGQRAHANRSPTHTRLMELLQSGQTLRGVTRLKEAQRYAIYTVNLSYRQRHFYYELYKDGIPYQCLVQKDFSRLADEIEQAGILQLEELELPF